jgi:hypothetical protein
LKEKWQLRCIWDDVGRMPTLLEAAASCAQSMVPGAPFLMPGIKNGLGAGGFWFLIDYQVFMRVVLSGADGGIGGGLFRR